MEGSSDVGQPGLGSVPCVRERGHCLKSGNSESIYPGRHVTGPIIDSESRLSFFRPVTIMAEALQKLILDTLDAHSVIKDTRALVLPGQTQPASSTEDQILILGALNSLLSREASPILSCLVRASSCVHR